MEKHIYDHISKQQHWCSYCYRRDCRCCTSSVRGHRWIHSWAWWIIWHGLLPWVSCWWLSWIVHRWWCGLAWCRATWVSWIRWHSWWWISSRWRIPSIKGLLFWRRLPKATWRDWGITSRCWRIYALWYICSTKGPCQIGCLQWQPIKQEVERYTNSRDSLTGLIQYNLSPSTQIGSSESTKNFVLMSY